MKKILILLLFFILVSCAKVEEQSSDIKKDPITIQTKDLDIEMVNSNQETALMRAVVANDVLEAKRLIDLGANVNYQDLKKDSPFLFAGAEGRNEILDYMLQHSNIDFSVYNRFGGNALIPAAEKGHLANVKLLLADGRTDIDLQNDFGYTALIEAVALTDGSEIFQEIVLELLEHNANLYIKDNYGYSALDYARDKSYYEIENILLEYQDGLK